jgi:hypothetical protein
MVTRRLDALITVVHRGIDELEAERDDLEDLRMDACLRTDSVATHKQINDLNVRIGAMNQLIESAMEGLTYLREWRVEKSWKKVLEQVK